MKFVSQSREDTLNAARMVLARVAPKERASIIALSGELGAGKTNLTQEIGKLTGVVDNMHSPTFVIMKIYNIDFQGFKNLIHVDAYRIEKESELTHLGWENMIMEKENLILVEWPENVPSLIPQDALKVNLSVVDEKTREIKIDE